MNDLCFTDKKKKRLARKKSILSSHISLMKSCLQDEIRAYSDEIFGVPPQRKVNPPLLSRRGSVILEGKQLSTVFLLSQVASLPCEARFHHVCIPLAVYCVIRRVRPTNSKFHPRSGFIPTKADLVKKRLQFCIKITVFFGRNATFAKGETRFGLR